MAYYNKIHVASLPVQNVDQQTFDLSQQIKNTTMNQAGRGKQSPATVDYVVNSIDYMRSMPNYNNWSDEYKMNQLGGLIGNSALAKEYAKNGWSVDQIYTGLHPQQVIETQSKPVEIAPTTTPQLMTTTKQPSTVKTVPVTPAAPVVTPKRQMPTINPGPNYGLVNDTTRRPGQGYVGYTAANITEYVPGDLERNNSFFHKQGGTLNYFDYLK